MPALETCKTINLCVLEFEEQTVFTSVLMLYNPILQSTTAVQLHYTFFRRYKHFFAIVGLTNVSAEMQIQRRLVPNAGEGTPNQGP